MKNEISVHVHCGALSCSTSEHEEVVSIPSEIPGFKFCGRVKRPRKGFEKVDSESLFFETYMKNAKFCNEGTVLKVFSKRRDKHSPMPPLVLIFQPNDGDRVSCKDVFSVRDHFLKEHNLPLRPDEIQLVVEMEALEGTGLHDMVTKSLITGKARRPYNRVGKKLILDMDSPNRVVLTHLVERCPVGFRSYLCYDWSVLKMRIALDHLKDSPATLEELAGHDWTHVYGEYFSLLQPTELLRKHDGYRKTTDAPIWDLEECMDTRYGIPPFVFYRDYVQDHPLLTDLVRDALAAYRCCSDYQE